MLAADERQTDNDWLGGVLCIDWSDQRDDRSCRQWNGEPGGANSKLESAGESDDDGITKAEMKMVAVAEKTATDVKINNLKRVVLKTPRWCMQTFGVKNPPNHSKMELQELWRRRNWENVSNMNVEIAEQNEYTRRWAVMP